MNGSDSVTCSVRKYVLHMRNRKLRNIRPSGGLLTGSDVSHVTGSMFCACPLFSPRFFLSISIVVTWLPDVTEVHLSPSGFPWVCACPTGSCATPIVAEGHVIPSEVSLGCSLRRLRPLTIRNSRHFIFI